MAGKRKAGCWKVLDIEPTDDERAILRAYAKALKSCRPDENPEGFQRLVEAREQALEFVRRAVPPQSAKDRVEDEVEADHAEPTDGDERAPPETATVSGPAGPGEAGSGEAGPIEVEDLLAKVLERLDETVASSSPWSAPGRNVAAWGELFQMALDLDFNAMQQFHNAVARNLIRVFPEESVASNGDVPGLQAGTGILALAELIETECQFTWYGMRLSWLAGGVSADRYLFWQAQVKAARGLLARRENPASLKDEATGLPVFPEEDKPFLLARPELKEFAEESMRRGRKLFSPDWVTAILPIRRLFYYGMNREAAGWLTIGVLLALFQFRHSEVNLFIRMGLIILYFALCIFLACDIKALSLKGMAAKVASADRMNLLGAPRRAAMAAVNTISPQAGYLAILEFLVFGVLLAFLVTGVASYPAQRLLSKQPVVMTLDNQMITLLEKTAHNRFILTSTFFDLMNDHLVQRHNVEALGHTVNGEGLGMGDRTRLTRLERGIGELGSDQISRAMALSLTVERTRKLDALLADYKAGSVERRRQIEQLLTRWKPLLLAATADPRLEASIWSVMPVVADGMAPVVVAASEFRRAALDGFLKRVQDGMNGRGSFKSDAVEDGLYRILTATEAELLAAATPDGALAQPDLVVVALPGSDDGARDGAGLSSLYDKFDRDDLSQAWSEKSFDWRLFAHAARVCLRFADAAEREMLTGLLKSELASERAAGRRGDIWRSLAMKVIANPACQAYYTGAMGQGEPDDGTFAISLNRQLESFQGDQKVDEVRQSGEALWLARFMLGSALRKAYSEDQFNSAAVVMAFERLHEKQIPLAIEYIDRMRISGRDCPAFALRGYTMLALGDDRAARAELSAAIVNSQNESCYIYGLQLRFDLAQLRADRKALDVKLGEP